MHTVVRARDSIANFAVSRAQMCDVTAISVQIVLSLVFFCDCNAIMDALSNITGALYQAFDVGAR